MLTTLSVGARLGLNAVESLFFMLPGMYLAYTLMYVVIPKMIVPAKYLRAALSIIALLILTAALSALISLTILDYLRKLYLARYFTNAAGAPPMSTDLKVFLAMMAGLRGSITIGGLAAAIKLMKYYYEKQQDALLLEQERTIAELQSLKAQLHPHFLFNTLNNIYAHTQETAPVAADMIIGLSGLLRYILYTCNAPVVKLDMEISMILAYIELEKKRYGNQLEVAVHLPVATNDCMIAPLLILPFIENSFKHGASDMLDKPWINIHISLNDRTLFLKVINAKVNSLNKHTGGIGISNVRRRLDLLYPGKFLLDTLEEEEVYIVNLKIDLKEEISRHIQSQDQVTAHDITRL